MSEKKLSKADINRIAARGLFVDANYSRERIAETLEVGIKTVDNYKTKDKSLGFDWLTLRAAKHIKDTSENKENMYSMFMQYMMDSLKDIRENEQLSAEKKTQAIVSLGDSFSKMGKVARQEDPEAYKLGLIKHVVQHILLSLKEVLDKETMEKIIDVVYSIQEDLIDVSI
ncbi:MAG: DUF1804 family protein [Sphaerochaetaceae bacterium]|nr:DUF1804 family protein [Sphaerochaetaceae bacterium]